MAGKLKDEIKQTRPFRSIEQEAMLNLMRTSQVVSESSESLFKQFGLSATQYNVMRILRGAREPLPCGEIAERMVHRDPDITRLLDRIEKMGFIKRIRCEKDRRVVLTMIEPKGLDLLSKLDEPVYEMGQKVLGHMGKAKLQQLIDLLEQARSA